MGEDTEQEKAFREKYSHELKSKTFNELEDERKKVSHQGMKTPGRRGEAIKHEEIDREIVRRYKLKQGSSSSSS